MAYFRENGMDKTRQQPSAGFLEKFADEEPEYVESEYDDGFDDPETEAENELSEEEQKEIRKNRFRVISGAGNLAAVITGTVVILALLAFLMSMIGFVLNDADRNFTLFQTRF